MPRAILSQATINYTKLGSWTEGRQPLVFVHGLASSSGFWFLAAELLGRSSPVVLFDLRGHGRSSIPAIGYCIADHAGDVIELLDYLAISSAVLIGHSFGGAVALQAALRRPERFSHLALADTRLRLFSAATAGVAAVLAADLPL